MLSTPTKADAKPPMKPDCLRLTGLQALARLPVEIMRAERRAGRNTAGFISGYEGSPLGGYDMELAGTISRAMSRHNDMRVWRQRDN